MTKKCTVSSIIVILLTLCMIMTSCMDKIERPNNGGNVLPEIKGFTGEEDLESTPQMLPNWYIGYMNHEYFNFLRASVIRNPWYENEKAEKERIQYIGSKAYDLKYMRTVITERFIADEYSYKDNERIRFRYYENTAVLVEIVGIYDTSNKNTNYSTLDDIAQVDILCNTKESIIKYSEMIAEQMHIELDGLGATVESIDTLEDQYMSAFIPGFYSCDKDKYDSVVPYEFFFSDDMGEQVYQYCIIWSENYDDGISVPKYKMTVDISTGSSKLVRVEYYPNTPKKEFTFSDEILIQAYRDTMKKEKSQMSVYKKEYDVVCNSIPSIKVVFIVYKDDGSFSHWATVRMFDKKSSFPEIPTYVNIPMGSNFPNGYAHSGDGLSEYNTRFPILETKE